MPRTSEPGRKDWPLQTMQRIETAIANLQTQQLHVITDPTEATGDPVHGHATVVIGPLQAITGLAGFGTAVYNQAKASWEKIAAGGAGEKGEPGKEGPAGKEGKSGADGKEGKTGPEGKEGKAGATGPEGPRGEKGTG